MAGAGSPARQIGSAESVAVIVPCRNEAEFIEDCIDALMAQEAVPKDYSVLVLDGMSDDGTREILSRLTAKYPRLRVLDNPELIVSTALNRGIIASNSSVVIRVDGHARFASDFVRANLELLVEHPEAWAVGGPIVHQGRSTFAKGVALAMSSRFGVGSASHRNECYEGYVESAQFPAIRRWVFDRVGTFDEDLVRNQDEEFNFRVTRSGGKIYISPRVKYEYFVRETPAQLWRQFLQYGYWKVPVMLRHGRPIALRHVMPTLFVVGTALCILGALVLPEPARLLAAAPIAAYLAAVCLFFFGKIAEGRKVLVSASASLAAMIMHTAYGCGTILGLLRPPENSPAVRARMRQISR